MRADIRSMLAALSLVACGDDDPSASGTTDGAGASGTGGVGSGGLYQEPLPVGSCDELCGALDTHCAGGALQFADAGSCQATCALYPEGVSTDAFDNSRACRLTFASDEYAGTDPAFCVQAGPAGTSTVSSQMIGGEVVCGGNCENYCFLAQRACSEYLTETDCLLACSEFDFAEEYSAVATTGFACRMAELTRAVVDPSRCANITAISPTCN